MGIEAATLQPLEVLEIRCKKVPVIQRATVSLCCGEDNSVSEPLSIPVEINEQRRCKHKLTRTIAELFEGLAHLVDGDSRTGAMWFQQNDCLLLVYSQQTLKTCSSLDREALAAVAAIGWELQSLSSSNPYHI